MTTDEKLEQTTQLIEKIAIAKTRLKIVQQIRSNKIAIEQGVVVYWKEDDINYIDKIKKTDFFIMISALETDRANELERLKLQLIKSLK